MLAITRCIVLAFWTVYIASAHAMPWQPTVEESPTLHTTTVNVAVQMRSPVPEKIVIDLQCVNQSVWRVELPTQGQSSLAMELTSDRFQLQPRTIETPPLRFVQVRAVSVTTDGTRDEAIASASIKFTGHDGVVYPWEEDVKPAAVENGATYWPGLHRTSGGHFAWRYEPNGLLINNVSFNCLERWWYYFIPSSGPSESFTLRFEIPQAIAPEMKIVERGDYDQNKAGLATRREYQIDKGIYAGDDVQADWTSFRWKRTIKTKSGREYRQELRYGVLGIGVQVETDSPEFAFAYENRSTQAKRAPRGFATLTASGVTIFKSSDAFDPKTMTANWIVLLGDGAPSELPTIIVFQHRPDRLEFTDVAMTVHRQAGIGTLAFETLCLDGEADPKRAPLATIGTLDQWAAQKDNLPLEHIQRFVNLLTAYPWKCVETFAVVGDRVHIRDRIEFLPWSDDWKTTPTPFSPIPPMVAYSISRGLLPKDSVAGVVDMHIPTKWGPYWARQGDRVEYTLPIPDSWDYFPMKVDRAASNGELHDTLMRSIARTEIEKTLGGFSPDKAKMSPTLHPHFPTADQFCGALHCMNFMPSEDIARIGEVGRNAILAALYPQNYRLRRDPLTGEQHLACTAWSDPEYVVNGENCADFDYWQGLAIYGLYNHAKYNRSWDIIAKHWPTIRSMTSYWEALQSWALMSPGAREAGEIFGGDMTAAGYVGLVGFNEMAKRLGTPFERDLSAYLLSLNAVPRVVMFDYMPWAQKLRHPELYGTFSAGYGECWVTSIKLLSNDCHDMSAKDPWWGTGPIGPIGAQPELLDLPIKRCRRAAIGWEQAFQKQCPDAGFLQQRPDNVMSHVMFRAYLSDTMRAEAMAFMKKYPHTQHMLRHAHVLASLLAWDVPVRLLDWSPAAIESATWNDATKTASIGVLVDKNDVTSLRLAIRHSDYAITIDGQTVTVAPASKWQAWNVVFLKLNAGPHRIDIKVSASTTTQP